MSTFKNYCTCGGYAYSMNGRPPDNPHMPWCPQKEEYDNWYRNNQRPATGPWRPFSEAPKDGVLLVRFDFDAVWYDIVDIGELRKMQFGKSLEFVEKTATHFAIINKVPE